MDFSKLAAQRAAKEQAAAEPPTESLADAKATRRQGGKSKRQGWKAATFYVRPETLERFRRVIALRKLEGSTGDLSDAVEEALQAWLTKAEGS